MNFKDIHIGNFISQKVLETGIENARICSFLKCSEKDLKKMYMSKSLDTNVLLRWSKLLEYDFFRIYSQHMILYSPSSAEKREISEVSLLPQFRKNIYTKELIDFILGQIKSENMTKNQVIEQYRIPKTTLHKWMEKYKD